MSNYRDDREVDVLEPGQETLVQTRRKSATGVNIIFVATLLIAAAVVLLGWDTFFPEEQAPISAPQQPAAETNVQPVPEVATAPEEAVPPPVQVEFYTLVGGEVTIDQADLASHEAFFRAFGPTTVIQVVPNLAPTVVNNMPEPFASELPAGSLSPSVSEVDYSDLGAVFPPISKDTNCPYLFCNIFSASHSYVDKTAVIADVDGNKHTFTVKAGGYVYNMFELAQFYSRYSTTLTYEVVYTLEASEAKMAQHQLLIQPTAMQNVVFRSSAGDEFSLMLGFTDSEGPPFSVGAVEHEAMLAQIAQRTTGENFIIPTCENGLYPGTLTCP